MKIKTLISFLENLAPPVLQESYDNSGLLTGNANDDITGVLTALDATEAVIEEAVEKSANVLIVHHPLVFKGVKQLTGTDYVQRCLIKAIKNDIAIYAGHTNWDNIVGGVNGKIAEILELQNIEILKPMPRTLRKLVTFVPSAQLADLRNALFDAGAGQIGDYDKCSYNLEGYGTFRAPEGSNPFAGEIGKLHTEPETRVETIYPYYKEYAILKALYDAHPYEEPAYDIYPLENTFEQTGAGIVGYLAKEEDTLEFLNKVKERFDISCIRHTNIGDKKIKKVALCGGAGSFLIHTAKAKQADIFLSGDIKYHDFFDADNEIIIADIGHYESEQFTKKLFYELITKKFSNFACSISAINTNPINYL